MWRVAALVLALQAALAASESFDGPLPAAEGDDECLATGEGGCALSALQRRGVRVSAEAQEPEGQDPELEAQEGGADAARDGITSSSVGRPPMEGDISRKDASQMLRRIHKHDGKIRKLAKEMSAIEKEVNGTYILVEKELSPKAKAVELPPMKKAHSKKHHSSRRRHHGHHASVGALPPRQKKVDLRLRKSESTLKGIWARIKRSSDMLLYSQKRITGGEIGHVLAQEQAEGGSSDGVGAEGQQDLEDRIKQLNTEIYDVGRDLKGMSQRSKAVMKLFNETFRIE